MSARASGLALFAALLLAPALARADAWDPGEVAEAEKLRADEAARAAAYRERVANGEVRAAAAPMPREAPSARGEGSAGAPLRDAADLIDRIERWLGGGRERAAPPPETPPASRREELRRRERERRGGDADAWWDEEERRTQGSR